MKNKAESPTGKRQKTAAVGHIRHGGFGVTKRSAKNVSMSMTPDRFERSQVKIKKATAIKQGRSLYNGNDTTQMYGSLADLSQTSQDDLEMTPLTLSQISAIDTTQEAVRGSKRKKKSAQNDETMEMAVQYARGEPDGAERSFTRKMLQNFTLDDEANDNDGMDEGMEVDSAEIGSPSPSKKAKVATKDAKTPTGKTKKSGLKEPLKQAAKKLQKIKSAVDIGKTKKGGNNFAALPDETTVPKTPKQTKKEKRKERKMTKNNYNLITTAKTRWEDLRRADLPAAKRKKICDDLMALTQGKINELSVVHDSSRVVQCLVQYGTEQQRNAVFEEVKGDICDLCKNKYAKFVVRKLVHYGSKDLKAQVFKCFHGQVRKLIRHKEASEILEYAYNDFANAPQRMAILEEFYGPTFSLFKDQVHQSLEQIMSEQPEKRDMVIRSLKEALLPLIDKEILSYSLVHKVFLDFFVHADDKSKKEMIEGLREYMPTLLHTRDGTRVAMHCVWAGSTKDRKAIVKSLKTHVVKVCKEEHGHLMLPTLFDCVDDTVLLQKAILDEMLKSLEEVLLDAHGKKVLLYLLSPRDPQYFNPDIQAVLRQGDSNPTSKKDKSVRTKELRNHVSSHLLRYLETHALDMLSNSGLALAAKAIIMHASGDLAPAMRAIADLACQPVSQSDPSAFNIVENPASHIALKKIIANDRTRLEAGEGILFSAILLDALPKSTVKSWAASNRGCFVLVSLLDVGCSTVSEKVRSLLQPVIKSLGKMTFKGAEILLERLDNKPRPPQTREFRV